MKKTNIILAIVISVFVISAIAILVIAIGNNDDKEEIPVNVDFTALSSEIKDSTSFDRTKLQEITIEDLETEFGIQKDWIKQVIGEKPYVNVTSSMYVIIEVTEGNVENVVNALKAYGDSYDEMWKDYLTEEYELVKNRQIGSKGNYVYLIVCDYPQNIVDLIK